ncbi:MAG TPA: PQQ-dependent sugar dehydrogenase [Kofleriaceae bacterium]|nr:PQQ-dependent sugar dehydrogenase [Kofleriaceae bacterium]
MRRRLLVLALALAACSRDQPEQEPVRTEVFDPAVVPAAETPVAAPKAAGGRAAPASWGPPSSKLVAAPKAIAAKVKLERVARGLDHPLALEAAPGDTSGRLFVVERGGRIRILRGGRVEPDPFLDVRKRVSRDHDERGLLGLAFHPRFATNGRFYINFTDRVGDTRVVELRVSAADPDRADLATERVIFTLDQPYANHNGGGLEFGPDGKLWIGTGDGGAAGDPKKAGQDRRQLLAKMLRIDVDAKKPAPEIVQVGLRNPWRYAFDPATGDLYVGDVGQDRWEEITVVAAGALEGANHGWSQMEGNHCYRKGCAPGRYLAPAVEYDHKTGCSVTGGEVYRGKAIPELDGVYFYADYCTAIVRSFRWARGAVYQHWDWKPVLDPDFKLSTIASFGVDADGELYIVTLDGVIYKLVPVGAPATRG